MVRDQPINIGPPIKIDDAASSASAREALAHFESELRAQSTLLQSVFDAMGEGVIVIRAGDSTPALNPAARRILSLDESFVWEDWLRTVSIWQEAGREPLASDQTPFARLANDPMSGEIEMVFRQPARGALRVLAATSSRLTDEDGVLLGSMMLLRDITERKLAEQSRAQLAGLIDATRYAGGGSWTMRADQIVLTWNPGAEQLYGYTADEMVARSIRMLNPPGRDPEACNLLTSRLVCPVVTPRNSRPPSGAKTAP